MSYKLKQDSIAGFSEQASRTICDRFYQSQERADGVALMKFTNSKQVNSFLVKGLFEKWQEETLNLQSPYFDFQHKEVKEALMLFMNKLSEHISVAQADLEPLLQEAIADTVLVTFAPAAYVEKVVKEGGSPSMKYIKVRKDEFKALTSLSGASESDFDEEPPVEPADFVADLGMELTDLFEEKSISFFERHEALEEEEEVEVTPEVAEELVAEEAEALEPVVEEPIIAEEAEEEIAPEVEEETISVAEEPGEEPAIAQITTENGSSETINDRFNNTSKVETLADRLKKNQQQSIEAGLNLNERIMFINSLFGGDKSRMSEALAELEEAENHDEAKVKAYKYGEDWDMESEEVAAFLEIIERRFA